jgi:hypothetical protein
LLAPLPFRFPFGCGALRANVALRRFLLALAAFVAVSSALTGALHVRLLTDGRTILLLLIAGLAAENPAVGRDDRAR